MIIYTLNNLVFFEKRSDSPNTDWTGKAEWILNENDPLESELSRKIEKYAPFISLQIDEATNKIIGVLDDDSARQSWLSIRMPTIEEQLINARIDKIAEISNACSVAITSGIDILTTQGTEHFSLEETDQINLSTAVSAIQQGATSYPYHADGKLCRMFSAEEIMEIVKVGTQHKLYHTTLCNHLFALIRSIHDLDAINNITYSTECLTQELLDSMNLILTHTTNI